MAQKLSIFFGLDEQSANEIASQLNPNSVIIVKDINQSDVFVKSSLDDLSDCILPSFADEKQLSENHFVVVYSKSKQLALRLLFSQDTQKLAFNLNILAYIWMLKQSIKLLPLIKENEIQFTLTIDNQSRKNKVNVVNQFQKVKITAINSTCVDQYYYLLLISESGIIRVIETGLNNLKFKNSFIVDEQSPFHMTHQIDSLVLISSPTKINLSDIVPTNDQGYFTKCSKGIFYNQSERVPPVPLNLENLDLSAITVDFDIQSCLEFENWSAMMKLIQDIQEVKKPLPPYIIYESITIVPLIENYVKDGQSAFEKTKSRLTSKDLDKFLEFYSIHGTYKEDEDDKYHKLIFKRL